MHFYSVFIAFLIVRFGLVGVICLCDLSYWVGFFVVAFLPRMLVFCFLARARFSFTPRFTLFTEIAEIRKESQRARRRYHRSRHTSNSEVLRERYRALSQSLKKTTKARKSECFMQLCNEADNTSWGMAYKVVMKKLKAFRRPAPTAA